MTRQEFLQELDLALQGQMGQAAINENIRYYETYINITGTRIGSKNATTFATTTIIKIAAAIVKNFPYQVFRFPRRIFHLSFLDDLASNPWSDSSLP